MKAFVSWTGEDYILVEDIDADRSAGVAITPINDQDGVGFYVITSMTYTRSSKEQR
jgi:hypothetical protein